MQIQDIAERLLLGERLEDKLFPIKEIQDSQTPWTQALPSFPGRPYELRLDKNKSTPFPKPSELNDERKRAFILHFFANHELLAIELMALALLKFPQAPRAFRKGIVQTITEEQEHMKLYMERMKELKVELGEISVNDFFWRSMREMKTPMEYITQMSLTFEQANLDFSLYYQQLMKQLGDEKTSSLLRQVFVDELSHVKFGFQWFKKWSDPQLSQWQNYCENLKFPITPMRAKGNVFHKNLREKLGFDDDYTRRLEVFSQSKGKAPQVHFFNPGCENEYQNGSPRPESKTTIAFRKDLDVLPLFYSQSSDILLVHQEPHLAFLEKLQGAGFSLPEFHVNEQSPLTEIQKIQKQRKIEHFSPWGWTPQLLKEAQQQSISRSINCSFQELQDIFSKAWSLKLAKIFIEQSKSNHLSPSEDNGTLFTNTLSIKEFISSWFAKTTDPIVIKCPYGFSGQGQKIINEISQWPHLESWVVKNLAQQKQLIVEPWLNKVFDFSIQMDVTAKGPQIKGIARFLTDEKGHYLGALVKNTAGFLSSHAKDFLFQNNRWKKITEQIANFVNENLLSTGYQGPVGIDSFVYQRKNGEFLFKPIVELNPRYNMGRVTVEFEKHLQTKSVGAWVVMHKNQAVKHGFDDLQKLSQEMQKRFPLKLSKKDHHLSPKTTHTLIQSGYLETSPISKNSLFSSFLLTFQNEKLLQENLQTFASVSLQRSLERSLQF